MRVIVFERASRNKLGDIGSRCHIIYGEIWGCGDEGRSSDQRQDRSDVTPLLFPWACVDAHPTQRASYAPESALLVVLCGREDISSRI